MLNQHETTKRTIALYNKPNPLAKYLIPFLEGKKEVKIADIGCGPFSIIGRELPGIRVSIYPSDRQDFSNFYRKHNVTPWYPVVFQDMERLGYAGNFFDIVHCSNALDHTFNAEKAVQEMIRVCKVGGWVYIDCNLDQLETGGKHYWNAKEDGRFENYYDGFDLKWYGFNIRYIDNGGERRYNRIIATLKKNA